MYQDIPVKSLIEPTIYRSFEEAIVGSKQVSNLQKKLDHINGKTAIEYGFDGITLKLYFDSQFTLRVSIADKLIKWDVEKTINLEASRLDQNYTFIFPNGEKFKWGWDAVFSKFIGKQVAISTSDQYLFIFYRGGPEFMFSSLVNSENDTDHYLFLAEA
ncbi:hypothetical protein [Gynuella sp.]|uniref:hypothetical protein n=1 Tax=Gynuella sp. TaxID=2969146 RepID=UPI003D102290